MVTDLKLCKFHMDLPTNRACVKWQWLHTSMMLAGCIHEWCLLLPWIFDRA